MNQYSVDFKLKIVKMILKEHISKKSIMREYNVATNHKDSGYISIRQRE